MKEYVESKLAKLEADAPEKDDLEAKIENIVERVLFTKFNEFLEDVDWRINQIYDQTKIPAEGLNLKSHMLTGYTVTNASPTATAISWSDVYVVYSGQKFGPFTGDTTNTYVWFDYSAAAAPGSSANIIETDTKPTLAKEDCILFINTSGTAKIAAADGNQPNGAQLVASSVNTGEITDGAITSGKVGASAITAGKLGTNAVTSGAIASGAVGSTALAAGAVSSSTLQTGSVTSGAIATGAVGSTALAAGAVSSTSLQAAAVATDKLLIYSHLIF